MKKNLLLILTLGIIAGALQGQVSIQANGSYNYATILCNGSSSEKYDIVFIGDGFTSGEQTLFDQKVEEAVNALKNLSPYKETMCSFNIWRVNVLSPESGVDHPEQGISRNSALDCRYGNPPAEAERCIRSDSPAKCYEAAGYAPAYDAVFVLVNDTQWGGCAGGLVFSSISANFHQIITHELGHKVGNLADEYDCYVCDGSDDNLSYTGGEHARPNLTNNTNRATTKWADLIAPSTAIPTTSNVPAGVVGLWEGGGYYENDLFRPQFNCQMRSSSQPFCAVCNRAMRDVMVDRCTACELNPLRAICWFDRLDRWRWIEVVRWRIPWPWPPCLSCPFDLNEVLYEIRFDEKILAGSSLVVKDEFGKVLGRGAVQKNGEPLIVTFKGNRFKAYSLEFESGKPQAERLSLNPKITAKQR